MLTAKDLIEFLQKFPSDAIVYAYEGEVNGIGVTKNGETAGFINDKNCQQEIYVSNSAV